MIKDLLNKINEIKQSLYGKINSLPQNEGIENVTEQPRTFTVRFSQTVGKPLAPYYYDYKQQYKMIVDALEHARIENFEKVLIQIIETERIRYQNHTYVVNPEVIQYLKSLTD